MYKIIVKFEEEPGTEKGIVKNAIEVYNCEQFSFINDSMLGIKIDHNNSVIIPVRRIRDIKVTNLESGD